MKGWAGSQGGEKKITNPLAARSVIADGLKLLTPSGCISAFVLRSNSSQPMTKLDEVSGLGYFCL